MADNQVTVEQLLRGLGQAILQMSEKMDVLAAKLDAVRDEVAKTSTPALPGEGFFESQFGRLEAAVAGSGSRGEAPSAEGSLDEALGRLDSALERMTTGIGDKIDALSAGLAGRETGQGPADLSGQLAGLGEKLAALLSEVNASIRESAEQRTAGINEASGFVIDAIGSIPDAVKAMQSSLEERAEAVRAETAAHLEKAEAAMKSTELALEDMNKAGRKTEKAVEAVKEELSKGLERNIQFLTEMQEVTERFAGKAMEEGISTLNRSAVHHYNLGEYAAASEDLKEAINLDANRPEIWCNLAHVQAASGEEAEAEASFRKALEIKPDLDQAVSGLGVLLLAGGRTGESISFLEKFMADEAPSIRTMIAYSRALAEAGRHSEAVLTLERASALAPGNPDVKAELAAYTGGEAN